MALDSNNPKSRDIKNAHHNIHFTSYNLEAFRLKENGCKKYLELICRKLDSGAVTKT